jgi:hypothetical protein
MDRVGADHLPTLGWKEVPNPKGQIPKNLQTPILKSTRRSLLKFGKLEISWGLGFETWDFRRKAAVSVGSGERR